MKRLLFALTLFWSIIAVNAEDAPKTLIGPGKWEHSHKGFVINKSTGTATEPIQTDFILLQESPEGKTYTYSYYESGKGYRSDQKGTWSATGDTLELWEVYAHNGSKRRLPHVWKIKAVSDGVISLGLLEKVAVGIDSVGIKRYEMQVKEWKEFRLLAK